MICVYIRNNFIEVKGHANYGPLNYDIVCASVSAIVLGAAYAWLKNANVITEQKSSGYIKITFINNEQNQEKIKAEINFLTKQLEIMATNYQDFVTLDVKN